MNMTIKMHCTLRILIYQPVILICDHLLKKSQVTLFWNDVFTQESRQVTIRVEDIGVLISPVQWALTQSLEDCERFFC